MRGITLFGVAAFVVLALSGQTQTCQLPSEMRPTSENVKFTEGTPGAAPPGWFLGPYWWNSQLLPAHDARIVSGPSCNGSPQCATIHSLSANAGSCFLYQIVDATQYRGKKLIYRADVRADVPQGSVARLLVRVHRTNCSTSFRDDMGNHPITVGTWSPYEIQAPIALDAQD